MRTLSEGTISYCHGQKRCSVYNIFCGARVLCIFGRNYSGNVGCRVRKCYSRFFHYFSVNNSDFWAGCDFGNDM